MEFSFSQILAQPGLHDFIFSNLILADILRFSCTCKQHHRHIFHSYLLRKATYFYKYGREGMLYQCQVLEKLLYGNHRAIPVLYKLVLCLSKSLPLSFEKDHGRGRNLWILKQFLNVIQLRGEIHVMIINTNTDCKTDVMYDDYY